MIKTINLIWNPTSGWDGIIRNRISIWSIFGVYLLPMLLLACLGEGIGLHAWRTWTAGPHGMLHFSLNQILVFETLHFLIMLVVVATCAHIVWLLREPFYGGYNYPQALMVVVCSFGPLFLAQFFDGFHRISLWIPWGVGVYFSLKIFYSGIRNIAKTDPQSAVGLYFLSSIVIVGLTGAQRFMLIQCLSGHGASVNNYIFGVAAKLPF